MPKKIGRPRKPIDWDEFEKLCLLQCSLNEICLWFHVSDRCLERGCKEHYGLPFVEVFAKKRVGGLISLRRNLFKQSETNPACAIFLAKNLLGMADRQEEVENGGPTLQINITVTSSEAKDVTKKIMAGVGT